MPQPKSSVPGSRKRATAQDLRELNAVFKECVLPSFIHRTDDVPLHRSWQ